MEQSQGGQAVSVDEIMMNRIWKQHDDLVKENQRLQDKINNLIEAGNELRDCASRIGTVASGEASVIRRTQEAIENWDNKTK